MTPVTIRRFPGGASFNPTGPTRQESIIMSLQSFSLEGKTALVTGANTGLGQGVALALAQAGADIAAAGIVAADETGEKVRAMGRRFINIEANLGSIDPVSRIVQETVDGLGGLDILVNNAGLIRRQDALDFSEKDWDDVMNVNIKSAFFMCQAAGRVMAAQGSGKIINIASMLSFQGGIRVPSYTASKSGIAGITRLLACEWASKGINVNAIAPGYMATDNTAQLRADEQRSSEILGRIPAGRWGEPSDLGGAAVFLASRAADYLHGTIIPVDGGWLAR
jgi:2-dehydro-3-deoxy-D-gluconate 5-dehydrogenase